MTREANQVSFEAVKTEEVICVETTDGTGTEENRSLGRGSAERRETLKIIIEGKPKEIAALVQELQERQDRQDRFLKPNDLIIGVTDLGKNSQNINER